MTSTEHRLFLGMACCVLAALGGCGKVRQSADPSAGAPNEAASGGEVETASGAGATAEGGASNAGSGALAAGAGGDDAGASGDSAGTAGEGGSAADVEPVLRLPGAGIAQHYQVALTAFSDLAESATFSVDAISGRARFKPRTCCTTARYRAASAALLVGGCSVMPASCGWSLRQLERKACM